MKAIILAAGLGSRMKNLTNDTPKPLLKVHGRYLIEYSLQALAEAGFNDIIINVSYLGEQIPKAIGDGSRYGVKIQYSIETERLETGGGIKNALPLLGDELFLAVSSDIITDFCFAPLKNKTVDLAHLVIVKKPDYLAKGDFSLVDDKIVFDEAGYTYANIGVYDPKIFSYDEDGYFPLIRTLRPAIEASRISGETYDGKWINVGTKELLALAGDLFPEENEEVKS